MRVHFNTNTFNKLIAGSQVETTTVPSETDFLVLGAKKVNYTEFINLKAVYRFGVGSNNVDFDYLNSKSIPVYFPSEKAKAVLYDGTANFTVYAILSLLYKDAFGDPEKWKKTQRNYIGEKNALVIGAGNIGGRVASKLKSFMKVKTYDSLTNKENELEALIKEADIITTHIPSNEETKNFFDAKKLSWIKDDAVIVNTARAELFDENALYEKLKDSNCRAFFDVFWKEPYDGKLKSLGSDKFFMTPHSASNTKEFIREGFNDILNILKGI